MVKKTKHKQQNNTQKPILNLSEYDVKINTVYEKNSYRNVLGNLNNFTNNMINKDIKYLSKN